jgi:DNA helicase MCM8
VIAASNPVGGHYDKLKSISENIKVSSALLSRFDVVFILLDRPDKVLLSFCLVHWIDLALNED